MLRESCHALGSQRHLTEIERYAIITLAALPVLGVEPLRRKERSPPAWETQNSPEACEKRSLNFQGLKDSTRLVTNPFFCVSARTSAEGA